MNLALIPKWFITRKAVFQNAKNLKKLPEGSFCVIDADIKNESIEVLFHISACAFILTNPMLSGVTFLF
jgi:hypothetical protein